MLNSVYFLLTLIAVVLLLVWSLRNDKAAAIKDQFGLFAMRIPDGKPRGSSKKQPYVPGQNAAAYPASPHPTPDDEQGAEPRA